MGERRNHAGGALLGLAGLCWVSTVIADGTKTLSWGSLPSVVLLVVGGLCLLGSLWAFGVLVPLLRWLPWSSSEEAPPSTAEKRPTSRRRSAPSSVLNPARVLRRPAEPPPAPPKRRPAKPQPKRSSNHNALVAELGDVRHRLAVLRDQIAPPKSYASTASFMAPLYMARSEEKVRLLARAVRFKLADGMLTWCVERFDEGLDLPPTGNLPGISGTATKDELVTFIDEKREALRDIIEHLGNQMATDGRSTAPVVVARGNILVGSLPDTLASLYGGFRALREKVEPERVPAYKLVLHAFKAPAVAALEQQEAQRLDGAVRRALTDQAQRFVPDWDAAASLPPHDELVPGVPAFTADAKKIAEFLDAKMVVLRSIISELREGR